MACRGPDTFARSVAAYSLLTVASLLTHAFLTSAVPTLLAPLLAALADPAPFVQGSGAHVLRHMAEHATAASLYFQRDLLIHAISRCLQGCNEAVWPAALPCAFALAQRLDSVHGGCQRLLQMLDLAITEAARGGHQASIRQPFLHALCSSNAAVHNTTYKSAVQLAGLQLVCRFRQLLPLLLEWMSLVDREGLEDVCTVRCTILARNAHTCAMVILCACVPGCLW